MKKHKIVEYCVIIFALFSSHLIAQKTWELDSNIAQGLSASVYLPDMEMTAFINSTTINYVPVSGGETISVDLSDYGELPWDAVTTAVKWDNSNIMLFNGLNYVMLDTNGPSIIPYGDFPGLPSSWRNSLDGAVEWGDTQILFFNENEFVIYDKENNSVSDISNISDWSGWELSGVDAALNTNDGYLYFFKNNQYQVLNQDSQAFESGASKLSSGGGFGGPPVAKRSGPPVANSSTIKTIQNRSESSNTTSAPDTSNWCLTGMPSGDSDAGLIEDATAFVGGSTGDEFEDNVPQGARVVEIRVWGSYVIMGLQTVIQTEDGEIKELPILGSKKGRTQTFKVPEGDCITGVKGAYLGDYGDFIHNMSFITSSTKSKNFGLRGRKPFESKLASGLSFYGFKVKFNNYISGISLKFVGYEGEIPEEDEKEDNFVSTDDFSLDQYKGEYDDNHEDIMEVAMDAQFFGAGEAQRKQLPAVEWLGQGVDYLYLDPLKIAESAKATQKESPFTLITSMKPGGMQGNELIPYGTDYLTLSSGKSKEYKEWNESYSDFTTNFGIGVGVSVGTPVGGGSASGSYKQMNNTKIGNTEIYFTRVDERKIFNLNMDLTWRDKKTGRKKRQKLDFDFREMIDNLPVPSSVPQVRMANMKKNRPLPSQIRNIRSKYKEVIETYGTHFIANADFGGKFVASTRITKKAYEATRQTEAEFKASVNAKIKAVDIGADVSFEYGSKSIVGNKSETFKTNKFVQGGAGKTFEEWDKSVENTPLPILVKLKPTYDLLDKKFWPKDDKIDKKRAVLEMVTNQYLVDNGITPTRSKGGFFSAPKAIEYTYTLKVRGIKLVASNNYQFSGDADVFGSIQAGYSGNGGSVKTIWQVNADAAISIEKDMVSNLNKDIEITLPEDKAAGGFIIRGSFKEAQNDAFFDGLLRKAANDYGNYGTRSKTIPLSDFTEQSKEYSVTGFEFDSMKLEIIYTIVKTPDYFKETKKDDKE